MAWTEKRTEILKKMWLEGYSAAKIAKELGEGLSRNAVIGKVHRLGLGGRGAGTRDIKASIDEKTKTKEKASKNKIKTSVSVRKTSVSVREDAQNHGDTSIRTPTVEQKKHSIPNASSKDEIPSEALERVTEVEKKAKKIHLMELTERTCKWPIGDPATDDFWFCGLPSESGKPYCEAHVGVAFQPIVVRKDRRR